MIIRWVTEKDLPAWYALATEVSPIDVKRAQGVGVVLLGGLSRGLFSP